LLVVMKSSFLPKDNLMELMFAFLPNLFNLEKFN